MRASSAEATSGPGARRCKRARCGHGHGRLEGALIQSARTPERGPPPAAPDGRTPGPSVRTCRGRTHRAQPAAPRSVVRRASARRTAEPQAAAWPAAARSAAPDEVEKLLTTRHEERGSGPLEGAPGTVGRCASRQRSLARRRVGPVRATPAGFRDRAWCACGCDLPVVLRSSGARAPTEARLGY